METRSFVVALVAILNFAVDTLEKLISEDGGDEKSARPNRAKSSEAKPRKGDDEDKGGKDDKDDEDDEVSEDELIDAVRAAQKVLEKADIAKILKAKGKAARASEVEASRRKAVIDALEEAIENAD